ncbi:unnamed protein product, partial [Heterobilharzia americana]
MTEKRPARIRKVQNYSLLAGDSDNEFFEDCEPVKHKKSDDDDEKSASKPTKAKKKTVKNKSATIQSETTPALREKPPEKINVEAKQINCISTVSHSETSRPTVSLSSPKTLSKSVPCTPVHSPSPLSNLTTPPSLGKTFFPVTPS